MMDDSIRELDLNRDQSNGSMLGLGSQLNESETTYDQIRERIRQIQVVTARERQRERRGQTQNLFHIPRNALFERIDNIGSESMVEGTKIRKRDSFHLVAEALELHADVKKVVGEEGDFFDCNLCFEMAREPILTCCGHLFCWTCFYELPVVYSTAKECPVCNGEVTDTSITPIYGNGGNTRMLESESGVKMPPRPKAQRIDSIRQQQVNRGISYIPFAEVLGRTRMGIGVTGERQVMPETAASLSSVSSGSDNQRFVEDHRGSLNVLRPLLERTDRQVLPVGEDHITSNAAFVHDQTVVSTADINSAATLASSSERMDPSISDVHLENPRPDAPSEINLAEPRPSSSSRRRNRLSRVTRVDNGVSRPSRRRRLNFPIDFSAI